MSDRENDSACWIGPRGARRPPGQAAPLRPRRLNWWAIGSQMQRRRFSLGTYLFTQRWLQAIPIICQCTNGHSNVRKQHEKPQEAAAHSPGGWSGTLRIPPGPRSRSSGSRGKSQVASWVDYEWAAGAPECWLILPLHTALQERNRGRGFLIAPSSCRPVVQPLLVAEVTCWNRHYLSVFPRSLVSNSDGSLLTLVPFQAKLKN